MNKIIAILFVIVLISGCVGQTSPETTEGTEELSTEDALEAEISELETMENGIDDSDIENMNTELDDIDWS